MSIFRLLIVEDNEQDLIICRDCVLRYKDEKQREVELIECKSIEEFRKKRDNSIDGAIIDLKLAAKGGEGNQVLREIEQSHFRIPVAVLTGTPDDADNEFSYIGLFKKGDQGSGYTDLLDSFWGIHNTGLTRIMGGRGKIEDALEHVFKKNLMPEQYRKKWVEYGKIDSARTEKALLRHALSHLLQLLDNDKDNCFPEEVYLTPPLTSEIRTGSIVKEKSSEQKFVVLNPACDIVIRKNGKRNTDRILTVAIDLQNELFPDHPASGLSNSQHEDLKKAFKNNKSTYYHWLPKTDFFEGGFLCFRKLSTLTQEDFNIRFDPPNIQISPSFVKDIIARFSAYYARQGQPEIDFERLITPSSL